MKSARSRDSDSYLKLSITRPDLEGKWTAQRSAKKVIEDDMRPKIGLQRIRNQSEGKVSSRRNRLVARARHIVVVLLFALFVLFNAVMTHACSPRMLRGEAHWTSTLGPPRLGSLADLRGLRRDFGRPCLRCCFILTPTSCSYQNLSSSSRLRRA